MDNYQGERFLDKVYKDLHLSEIVMHTANKSDDKYQKIEKYMQRLEDVTKKTCEHNKINLIKSSTEISKIDLNNQLFFQYINDQKLYRLYKTIIHNNLNYSFS